ncbi:hypothetical protein PanWU01x14_230870 [Parasponia andersonii]|uniref:Uncharacterized protein n=1 Tax=Parasponia andersonii TaxID=3476 RepID=A0A2P5BKJ9_PARAD|nr:hypothetical protein PanWU01x14_230870 [Parasponia andersonii]
MAHDWKAISALFWAPAGCGIWPLDWRCPYSFKNNLHIVLCQIIVVYRMLSFSRVSNERNLIW